MRQCDPRRAIGHNGSAALVELEIGGMIHQYIRTTRRRERDGSRSQPIVRLEPISG
jgi:hypothetical protein